MFKNITKKFSLFRPILAILILFIPLYPKFPLSTVKNTYVAIRLDDIIISISILIWVLLQIKKKLPILKNPLFKLFLIYFASTFLSTLHAILILKTTPTNLLTLHFLRRIEYMLVAFIAIDATQSKKDLKYPFIFLIIASVFVALYGYGQKYFAWPIISTMNEEFSKGYILNLTEWSRVSAAFAGHYDLAAFLSVILVLILGITLKLKKKLLKIPILIIWLILFQLLVFTVSRISIFAFWGGAVLMLLLIKKKLWIVPVSLLVIFNLFKSDQLNNRLVATIQTLKPKPTVTIIEPSPLPKPTLKFKPSPIPTLKFKPSPIPTVFRNPTPQKYPEIDIDAGVSRSGEIRFNIEWPRAINAFYKNPLLGTGLGSITLATDNDYLRLLGESGIFGFLSFFAIFFYFFIHSVKKKQNYLIYIFLACLFTTLANAIFIDVFEASKTAYLFWIMMGIYYKILKFHNHHPDHPQAEKNPLRHLERSERSL
ncbi:O-antigen ligase family protein [Patescibacteria group bacterium]|nr:O-antigen ligase family protein [Patescibacteria group bacterium]